MGRDFGFPVLWVELISLMGCFIVLRRRFRIWLWGYLKANWGAPFVLVFMGLLPVAAGLSVAGLPWMAEAVGNVAYFSLVVGVVLQLASFLRHGDKDARGKT